MNLKPKTYHLKPTRGFTVIELVVSTGIIIAMFSIILAYPRFKSRSSLNAFTREVALAVREAQVFGLASRGFSPSGSGDVYIAPYGVNISTNSDKEVVFFSDVLPGGGGKSFIYDEGDGCGSPKTECIRRITISGPQFIDKVCLISLAAGGAEFEEDCEEKQVNVTFIKPDPEAFIFGEDTSKRWNGAKIYFRSGRSDGEVGVIRIWISGQISIQ